MYKMRDRSPQRPPAAQPSAVPPSAPSPDKQGIQVVDSPILLGIMLLTVINLPKLHELVGFFVYLELGKVAILLTLFLILTAKAKNPVPWLRLPQVKLLLAYVLWIFVTAVSGVWPGSSISGGLNYLKTVLFFVLLLKSVYTVRDLYKLGWVLALSMIVFDFCIVIRAKMGRADAGGYSLDPNESALLISVTMPFLYYYFRANTGWRRLVMLLGMMTGTAAVLYSGSRGGVLSLCAVLVYAYFTDKGPLLKKILLVSVTIFLVFISMPQGLHERFSRLGDDTQDYNLSFKHGRKMVWERAVSLVEDRPLLGVGMNNFSFVESRVNNQSRGVVAHNFLLQTATELGLPGTAILVALFAVSWLQLRRLRGRLPREKLTHEAAVVASLECAWVAFFLGGQFLSVAFSSQIVFLAACTAVIWKCNLRGDFNHFPEMNGVAHA